MRHSRSPNREKGPRRKAGKRTKKIEVKLTPEELDKARHLYGRRAADFARRVWLSGSPPRARELSVPKSKKLEIAAALHAYHETVLPLRSAIRSGLGKKDVRAQLDAEEKAFNHLTNLWLSIYSARTK